ncbi:MAG: shikimate kinase [Candidatus Methanomethylophilaceae archaeon]
MGRKGRGIGHAAGSIVNAIATGKGASFGLDLKTWAEVEVNDSGSIDISMEGNPYEDKYLVHRCVSRILDTLAPEEGYGAKVVTRSEIPVSRGLKSSSAAANAVIRATIDALGADMEPLDAIRIGTESARSAGLSLTGAFDDACASWFGGICITDNSSEALLKRSRFNDGYRVVIHVAENRISKQNIPLHRISAWSEMMELCFGMVITRDYLRAMMLNGLCISTALGLDQTVVMDAMNRGAAAAAHTGTGMSTIILVKENRLDDFLNIFKYEGRTLTVTDVYYGDD